MSQRPSPDEHLVPAGWGIELDGATRRIDGGRVLAGGYPFRLLRLSAAGARAVDELAAGRPLPEAVGARRLAGRLVDAGLAHPKPATSGRPMSVSVVVPVRDETTELARVIAALGAVTEVIVVDDGSADPRSVEGAVAALPPGVAAARVLRHEAPRGPGAARNTGWRAAVGAVVAFVDADVLAGADWSSQLCAHLGDGAVAAVAPRVRSRSGTAPRWLAAYEASRSSLDLGSRAAVVRSGSPVPYVPTAALLVRREALVACGGFDEALPYGEDVDLVWRLAAAGWQVRYEPAVAVEHPSRPDLRAWLLQRYRYGTSAAALAERHGAAVGPLGTSGWSALAWGAVGVGHPLVGAAVAAGSTAALVPKLSALDHPVKEALRIAGRGHVFAGRSVADALRRPWWPLAALAAWRWRRVRPAVLAAALVPPAVEWWAERPGLDPLRYGALRALDDVAYGAGVWAGCARERSARALLPRLSGRIQDRMNLTARSGSVGPSRTTGGHRRADTSSNPVGSQHRVERRGHRDRRSEGG